MLRVWLTTKGAKRRIGRQTGFSPVEVLLAVVLFGFLLTGLTGAIIYGRSSVARSGERARAVLLADEGIEAVRNIRDAGYANLTDGTFGLSAASGQWEFAGSQDTTGIYTRQVTVTTVDGNRKDITVTVSWPSGSATRDITVAGRLANWLAPIEAPGSWPNAVLAGSYDAVGNEDGIAVATSGDYAYLVRTGGTPEFLVINISDPDAPSVTGSLTLSGTATDVAVSGDYAYVTTDDSSAELQIIDVGNPAAPSVITAFGILGHGSQGGTAVAASGTTVYVGRPAHPSRDSPEFVVVDASNPFGPSVAGSFDGRESVRGIYTSGNYAYAVSDTDSEELMVFDISNPSSPSKVASLNLPGTDDAVTIDGFDSTLLIGQGPVLHAISVSNPSNPATVGSFTAAGTAQIMGVAAGPADEYAFIGTTSGLSEFQVIDISNLASMSVVRGVDIPGTSSTLNDVAYHAGLDIVVGASTSDTQEFVIFKKN